jgi:hypothetical protein
MKDNGGDLSAGAVAGVCNRWEPVDAWYCNCELWSRSLGFMAGNQWFEELLGSTEPVGLCDVEEFHVAMGTFWLLAFLFNMSLTESLFCQSPWATEWSLKHSTCSTSMLIQMHPSSHRLSFWCFRSKNIFEFHVDETRIFLLPSHSQQASALLPLKKASTINLMMNTKW